MDGRSQSPGRRFLVYARLSPVPLGYSTLGTARQRFLARVTCLPGDFTDRLGEFRASGIRDSHQASDGIPVRFLALSALSLGLRDTKVRVGIGLEVVTPNVFTSRSVHAIWVAFQVPSKRSLLYAHPI